MTQTLINWKVLKYKCPMLGREICELWAGPLPCVPANVYLRCSMLEETWTIGTVQNKAYRLVDFFGWLDREGLSFWTEAVRRGGAEMLRYRDALLDRCYDGQGAPNGNGDEGAGKIGSSHARDIMAELLTLCDFWTQTGEQELAPPDPKRGKKGRKIPAAFRIKIEQGRPTRGEQSLSPDEYERVWSYWQKDARPSMPVMLRTRMRSEWPESRKEEYERVKVKWKLKMAWWSRNLMLWALMCTTGLRRYEIPGVMLKDVVQDDDGDYWITLVKPQHAPHDEDRQLVSTLKLARFKTGSRPMFVGWESRFVEAFHTWKMWRPMLIAQTGMPDHRMLLVNGSGNGSVLGSPLKVGGFDSWFQTTNRKVGPFLGDRMFPEPFDLSPHRIRHTLESLLREKKVPLEYRQAMLGHKKSDTTLLYGTTYASAHKSSLRAFAAQLKSGR